MAHYYERDKVHTAPARGPRHPVLDGSRPTVSGPTGSRPTGSGPTGSRPGAWIDCDTCPIAGPGCGDCMVALLGPVRLRLDAAEQRAVGLLVDCGLVSVPDSHEAYAVPDLPDWVVQSWSTPQSHDRGPCEVHDGRATG